jgi:hypothetical protein
MTKFDRGPNVSHYGSGHMSDDVKAALGRQGSPKAGFVREQSTVGENTPPATWRDHVARAKDGPDTAPQLSASTPQSTGYPTWSDEKKLKQRR